MAQPEEIDVVVIGGGQSGLAVGYYLRRTGLEFVILDAEAGPGAAWRHGWQSLRLFSPAKWSSLPGMIMPGGEEYYPSVQEFLDYLTKYEERYNLPIRRPVWVSAVRRDGDDALLVETGSGTWRAKAVVSATGSWRNPYIPDIPGREEFRGEQIHSADYDTPLAFSGQRVLVVGGANSGAQIMADVSLLADATWVTRSQPDFLPDDIDGLYLFNRATARYKGWEKETTPDQKALGLNSIVMVPSVLEARDRGALESVPMFERFTETGVIWPDGREEQIDAVIWCTGFRYAMSHLAPLNVVGENGEVEVQGTRSVRVPRLWLVGYGEWTGFASATIIGVGRSARATVEEIAEVLGGE